MPQPFPIHYFHIVELRAYEIFQKNTIVLVKTHYNSISNSHYGVSVFDMCMYINKAYELDNNTCISWVLNGFKYSLCSYLWRSLSVIKGD